MEFDLSVQRVEPNTVRHYNHCSKSCHYSSNWCSNLFTYCYLVLFCLWISHVIVTSVIHVNCCCMHWEAKDCCRSKIHNSQGRWNRQPKKISQHKWTARPRDKKRKFLKFIESKVSVQYPVCTLYTENL